MDTEMDPVSGTANFATTDTTNDHTLQHHTVIFEYPDFNLLPPGRSPIIEKPEAMAEREEPDTDCLGLMRGDLAIFFRFLANNYCHGVSGDDPVDEQESALGLDTSRTTLVKAMEQLPAYAGISYLRFITYVEDWDVVTIFELSTTYHTSAGTLEIPPRVFEMDSAAINRLIRTHGKGNTWVARVDDLLHARSDRAHLNRRQLMLDGDEDWCHDTERRWDMTWETEFPNLCGARQSVANKLVKTSPKADGTFTRTPLGRLCTFRNIELDVELPCGHRTTLPPNFIHDLSPKDCSKANCAFCGQTLLTPEDRRRVTYHCDLWRRIRWEQVTSDWVSKCKAITDGYTVVEISGTAISISLHKALDAFTHMPESMNPAYYRPDQYPETGALLNILHNKLAGNNIIHAMTPKTLLHNLEDAAQTILGDLYGSKQQQELALAPGFDHFLKRWLTCAVNDAVGDKVEQAKIRDQAMATLNEKLGRSRIDPNAAAVESSLDDVLDAFGDSTHLENTSEEMAEGGANAVVAGPSTGPTNLIAARIAAAAATSRMGQNEKGGDDEEL